MFVYFSLHGIHFDGKDKKNLYDNDKKKKKESHIGNEVFSGFRNHRICL